MSLNRKSIVYRCLVALLCLVCMIVFTYSWFNRENRAPAAGDRMLYNDSITVNDSANLDLNTYQGSVNSDGEIIYETKALESFQGNTIQNNNDSIQPGDKIHYKTTIINNGTKDCRATLLLKLSTADENIQIGVLKPMNTLKTYSSSSDIEIVRNVKVPADENGANNKVDVRWYVCFGTNTITLEYLHLFGN